MQGFVSLLAPDLKIYINLYHTQMHLYIPTQNKQVKGEMARGSHVALGMLSGILHICIMVDISRSQTEVTYSHVWYDFT